MSIMFPEYISPSYHVLIDFMLSGALKEAQKLVKEGFSDQFRVQDSGDVEICSN